VRHSILEIQYIYFIYSGFICVETVDTDGIGLLTTRSQKSKSKQKSKKTIVAPKYAPIKLAFSSQKYKDYFDIAKEGVLLKLV